MHISSLQFGLIVAGVLLVAGVLIYNYRVLRRARAASRELAGTDQSVAHARVEPSLRATGRDAEDASGDPAVAVTTESPVTRADAAVAGDSADVGWQVPMDAVATLPSLPTLSQERSESPHNERRDATHTQPDPDIESVVVVRPSAPIGVSALAAGLNARLGKPLRWFGRRDASTAWQRLGPESTGDYAEVAACLLLADRSGPASRNQIEAFSRLMSELAPTLPAVYHALAVEDEVARAEALDRLCAELDMQIGITIQKTDGSPIAGTRLRGVAEAAGFRLAPNGRFEWVHEETGNVVYTLQNMSGEPFTLDALRAVALNGVVCVLDVPCVGDPPRAFDQMKLAAGRLAHTMGGEMVDDNRRAMTEDALARTRGAVLKAATSLAEVHIEPGSPRALKLFSA